MQDVLHLTPRNTSGDRAGDRSRRAVCAVAVAAGDDPVRDVAGQPHGLPVRIYGRENLPETGGALLVANHVTWLDAAFILISSSRPIRMLAYADYVNGWAGGLAHERLGVIPDQGQRRAQVDGPIAGRRPAKRCRTASWCASLRKGRSTRTGQLQPFQRGLLKIVEGTGAPVIPVYLDGLWGSIFSFFAGQVFLEMAAKMAVSRRHSVRPADSRSRRCARSPPGGPGPGSRSHGTRKTARTDPAAAVPADVPPKTCSAESRRLAGSELTGGQLLLRTLILRRLLARHVLAADEKIVGLLLPPRSAGCSSTRRSP